MERNELAEKLELVGKLFEIDGMKDLIDKFTVDMGTVKFSAVVIQIESLLMRESPDTADALIAMKRKISAEEVDKLSDAEYAKALKDTIITDVIGFFG